MTRRITWSLHSELGTYYRPDFRYDVIQHALNFAARYWDIEYPRLSTPGRIKFVQSSQIGIGWAWTRRSVFTTWITAWKGANWGGDAVESAKTILHEVSHDNRAFAPQYDHVPGTSAIMSPGYSTAGNFTTADYRWWAIDYGGPYPWRSSLRPHHEPNALRETMAKYNVKSMASDAAVNVDEFQPSPLNPQPSTPLVRLYHRLLESYRGAP